MRYHQDICWPKTSPESPSQKKFDFTNHKFIIVTSEDCNTKEITKSESSITDHQAPPFTFWSGFDLFWSTPGLSFRNSLDFTSCVKLKSERIPLVLPHWIKPAMAHFFCQTQIRGSRVVARHHHFDSTVKHYIDRYQFKALLELGNVLPDQSSMDRMLDLYGLQLLSLGNCMKWERGGNSHLWYHAVI
jgi:hypothetical protein